MPRLTDRLLSKRLAEYRALARADAKASRFTMAWRVFEFFALGAGLAALWFSVISIQHASKQTELAAKAFSEQRIVNAWQILENSESEETRLFAYKILLEEGLDISGGDFSECATKEKNCGRLPRTMFVGTDSSKNIAWRSPTMSNMSFKYRNITPLSFNNVELHDIDFTLAQAEGYEFSATRYLDITFNNARLQNGRIVVNKNREEPTAHDMRGVSFTRAHLNGFSFANVEAYGLDFTNSKLSGSNFSGFNQYGSKYKKLQLPHINISGANLCGQSDDANPTCPTGLTQEIVNQMWYFDDNPPNGLDHPSLKAFKFQPGCPHEADDGTLRLPAKYATPTQWRGKYIGTSCIWFKTMLAMDL